MGKAIKVVLAGEVFAKKGDVTTRIREMMQRYQLMDYITGDDKVLCLNLFKYHPEYDAKLGAGITGIQVCLDDYGNKYFHLHRADGSDDDISWVTCLTAIK